MGIHFQFILICKVLECQGAPTHLWWSKDQISCGTHVYLEKASDEKCDVGESVNVSFCFLSLFFNLNPSLDTAGCVGGGRV
jgi:hypothetical protein